ncbi:MAG: hypothetical protein DMG36_14640 [Acidobacteria bacterium]|nr:MAG: hypothetical protein DMG36_14640 [Acidobacteriota bacterium]
MQIVSSYAIQNKEIQKVWQNEGNAYVVEKKRAQNGRRARVLNAESTDDAGIRTRETIVPPPRLGQVDWAS